MSVGLSRDDMSLHPKAQLAFDAANATFATVTNKPDAKIQLTSSVRTVSKQFELYIGYLRFKYFGASKPFAPANRPGTSNHEYGLAVDIKLGQSNEEEARQALTANGWVLHKNPNDPWHYDCSGIKEWGEIQAQIKKVRDTASQDFVVLFDPYLKSEQELNEGWPDRQAMLSALNAAQRTYSELVQREKTMKGQEIKLERNIVQAQDKLAKETERCRKFKVERVEGYEYTLCPNRNPLPQCTGDEHLPFRNRYLKERKRREDRLRLWEQKIQRGKQVLERDKQQLEDLRKSLAQLAVKLPPAKADFDSKKRAYNAKLETFKGDVEKVEDFESKQNDRIAGLQKVVDATIALW